MGRRLIGEDGILRLLSTRSRGGKVGIRRWRRRKGRIQWLRRKREIWWGRFLGRVNGSEVGSGNVSDE